MVKLEARRLAPCIVVPLLAPAPAPSSLLMQTLGGSCVDGVIEFLQPMWEPWVVFSYLLLEPSPALSVADI